jgi:hypothetical protein
MVSLLLQGNSYSGITPDTTAGVTPATNAGALSPIKIVSVGLCGSAFALLCCLYFSISVFREKLDTKILIKQRLDSLSRIIRNAAQSYLFEQYKWLCVWVACLSIIIACILRRDDNKVSQRSMAVAGGPAAPRLRWKPGARKPEPLRQALSRSLLATLFGFAISQP